MKIQEAINRLEQYAEAYYESLADAVRLLENAGYIVGTREGDAFTQVSEDDVLEMLPPAADNGKEGQR